jgi:hypothetical protein
MISRHLLVCLLLLLLLSGTALAGCGLVRNRSGPIPATQRATTAPAAGGQLAADTAAAPAILEPSQGRPIILRPGDRFYFLMRLGVEFNGETYISLVHSEVKEVYFPLALAGELHVQPQKHASMVLQVPADAPEGLYDLRVRGGGKTLTAPHSVKVVKEFKTRFRFVHLSDMNIGDPTAPDFDPRLPEEINLLAPEFIIATGDYMLPEAGSEGRTAWPAVLAYFARFRAPVYLLCGEHDDVAGFAPAAAASPIGSFDYGRYHGILLLNNASRPVDAGQMEFIRRDLAEHREPIFNFLAMNDDDPKVLNRLAGSEPPAAFVQANRIAVLICGGQSDWDGREYAATLRGLPGVHYIRTHAASTCRRGRATGTSHYRVIEVDNEDVSYVYPADQACGPVQESIPAGDMGVTIADDGADPPRSALAVVRNGLNRPFAGCRVWVRLAKRDAVLPKVAGGRLVQALDGRTEWLCEISVDLPDRSGVRIAVSADREPPAPLPVAVEFAADDELDFAPEKTAAGLSYAASDGKLVVRLRNTSAEPLTLRPVVRLQGQVLTVTAPEQFRWPLSIGPEQAVEMPMKLLLPDVVEGRHYVQVYFQEDPLQRLYLHPAILRRMASPPATRATQ